MTNLTRVATQEISNWPSKEVSDIKIKDIVEVFISRNRNKGRHRWLTNSMEANGLINPIAVRRKKGKKSKYELVFGQGRLEAAIRLKWKTIQAIVLSVGDDQRAEIWFTENYQRRPVALYDLGVLMLHDRKSGYKLADIAEKYNLSIGYVSKLIKTVKEASPKLRSKIKRNKNYQNLKGKNKELDMGKANEIVSSFSDHKDQDAIVDAIDEISSYAAEDLRTVIKRGREIKEKSPEKTITTAEIVKSLGRIDKDLKEQAETNLTLTKRLYLLKEVYSILSTCSECNNMFKKHKLTI